MAAPKRPYSEPERLSAFLPRLLREIVPRKSSPLEAMRRAWPATVGEAAAARTRLAAFDDGTLTVVAASSALKHDLSTFRHGEVLRALCAAVPEARLRDIRYRVGS